MVLVRRMHQCFNLDDFLVRNNLPLSYKRRIVCAKTKGTAINNVNNWFSNCNTTNAYQWGHSIQSQVKTNKINIWWDELMPGFCQSIRQDTTLVLKHSHKTCTVIFPNECNNKAAEGERAGAKKVHQIWWFRGLVLAPQYWKYSLWLYTLEPLAISVTGKHTHLAFLLARDLIWLCKITVMFAQCGR